MLDARRFVDGREVARGVARVATVCPSQGFVAVVRLRAVAPPNAHGSLEIAGFSVDTANEVAVSRDNPKCFRLYRVFAFSTHPRIYVRPGRIDDHVDLEATQYSARRKT